MQGLCISSLVTEMCTNVLGQLFMSRKDGHLPWLVTVCLKIARHFFYMNLRPMKLPKTTPKPTSQKNWIESFCLFIQSNFKIHFKTTIN